MEQVGDLEHYMQAVSRLREENERLTKLWTDAMRHSNDMVDRAEAAEKENERLHSAIDGEPESGASVRFRRLAAAEGRAEQLQQENERLENGMLLWKALAHDYRNTHNQRGGDGPCGCNHCRNYDAALEATASAVSARAEAAEKCLALAVAALEKRANWMIGQVRRREGVYCWRCFECKQEAPKKQET